MSTDANVLALIDRVVALGSGRRPEHGSGGTGAVTPVKVTVTMSDFKFRLSKTSVPKGKPIVFTVINRGKSATTSTSSGRRDMPFIAAGKTEHAARSR